MTARRRELYGRGRDVGIAASPLIWKDRGSLIGGDMKRQRVVAVLGVVTLLLFAIAWTVRVTAQDCCPVPNGQQPTSYSTYATSQTAFTLSLYSYEGTRNMAEYRVQEYFPTEGTNSCYEENPNLYPDSGPPPAGYGSSWWVQPGNTYGPDVVGWPPSTIYTYSTSVSLPCGFVAYQDMLFYCLTTTPDYASNFLSATITGYDTVQNCHEDMLGDYTLCQTISF